jgi:hypothetical protein
MLVRYRSVYGARMPFYIFQIGVNNPPSGTGFGTVRLAQEDVAKTDPYTKIVFRNARDFYARGLMADTYHYTQAGYNEMGAVGASNVVSAGANVGTAYAPFGEWVNVPYVAGNFTAGGAMTWTVTSGQQVTYVYTVINKTMVLCFNIEGTTVGGDSEY